MNLSYAALQADQAALNVTSNNVANQNTVGYTRQTVEWQTQDVVTLGGATTSSGVTVLLSSQRDRVLERRVQQQTQIQSQSAIIDSGFQQVQSIFGLSSTSTSASTTTLGSATDSFFGSLASLASNPANIAIRQNVLTTAGALAAAFNSAADQLAQISSSLDQQVGSIVKQVNSLASSIATLNGKIASLNPNTDAGVFEDRRQAAIAQLSQYVGLDQISTEHNGITLTTSDGSILVGGSAAYAITTSQIGGTSHVLAGAGAKDVTATIGGGQLGGVLTVRDQELPRVSTALDILAFGIGNQINLQNAQGIDSNGNAGGAIFSFANGSNGAAASIAVSATSPQSIASSASGEGSSGNGNAQILADLATASLVGGTTASSFYASLLSQIGSNAASATTDNQTQQAELTQLVVQRDSLSGVSLDQEAANLTQYQRSYQAAAKVFSVADSIMAGAINLGQQTTVA